MQTCVKVLDGLAQGVGIRGIFCDCPATVTCCANRVDLKQYQPAEFRKRTAGFTPNEGP